jgi:xyloglucan:xyloglucosyl transferase
MGFFSWAVLLAAMERRLMECNDGNNLQQSRLAMPESKCDCHLLLAILVFISAIMSVQSSMDRGPASPDSTFCSHFWSTADADHYKLLENGEVAELVLDRVAAAGFASNTRYLFGRISIQMKLHPGDSAGTVTTFYTSSLSGKHDELDFEFLGNEIGKPYVLQTNVYAAGVGDREQRIKLWFDPTADFHNYTIHWNKKIIIFMVDETPIRVYRNNEDLGVPYPCRQPMSVFASLWNGEEWATQSGAIKLNWAKAPFAAKYRGYDVQGCEVPWYKGHIAPCISSNSDALLNKATIQDLDVEQSVRLQWVTENMLVYDYCTDVYRYPDPHPECTRNSGLLDLGSEFQAHDSFSYKMDSHTSIW